MTRVKVSDFSADLPDLINLIASSTFSGSIPAAIWFEQKVNAAREKAARVGLLQDQDAQASERKLDAAAMLVLGGVRPGSILVGQRVTPRILSQKLLSHGLAKLGYDQVPCDAYLRACITRIHINSVHKPVSACEPVVINTTYASTRSST